MAESKDPLDATVSASDNGELGFTETLHAGHVERYCPSCDASFVDDVDQCPTDGTALVKLMGPEADVIGKVIDGRFTIKAKVGAGGMGTVYRALQHSVGRNVAIKLVHPRLSRDTVAAKRFLREAKLCSRLAHSNTVMVLDFGQCDTGQLFMVMELLNGDTLSDLLVTEGKLSPRKVVEMTRPICAALEAAHGLQIVHRDLKPSNIMVVDQGDGTQIVKVLDFGLAKSLAGDDSTVTQSGMMMGTPQYVPPEIAHGQRADTRADLYSLGVIMYEMVYGTPPFQGDTVQSLLLKHASADPPPLPTSVPPALRAVIMKLLRKEPDDRYQSAAELSAALPELSELDESSMLDVAPVAVAAPSIVDLPTKAELEASERSNPWPKLAAIGLLAALAAAITAFVMIGGDNKTDPAKRPVAVNTPDATTQTNMAGAVDASVRGPAPSLAADAGAKPTKPVELVTISFRSYPKRARVMRDGTELCRTPCKQRFPKSSTPVQVRIEKRRYESHVLTFTPARSHLLRRVRLDRIRRATTKKPDSTKKPDTTKKPDATKKPDTTKKPEVPGFIQPNDQSKKKKSNFIRAK